MAANSHPLGLEKLQFTESQIKAAFRQRDILPDTVFTSNKKRFVLTSDGRLIRKKLVNGKRDEYVRRRESWEDD